MRHTLGHGRSVKTLAAFVAAIMLLTLSLAMVSTSALGEGIIKNPPPEKIRIGYDGTNVVQDWTERIVTVRYEELLGVDIEWVPYASEGDQFALMIVSGDVPDICSGFNNQKLSPAQVEMVCVEAGMFMPLNDYIFRAEGSYYANVLEERPEFKDWVTAPDGNIYTFINTDAFPHMVTPGKFYFTKEFLNNLNLEVPQTTEEFKNVLIAFRDQDANGNGDPNDEIPYLGGGWSAMRNLLMPPFQYYSGDYFNIEDDGTLMFQANTDGWREGLRFMNDLYNEQLFPEDIFTIDSSTFQQMYNQPQGSPMIVGARGAWVHISDLMQSIRKPSEFIVMPPLEGPSGQRVAAERYEAFGICTLINVNTKYPEVCFDMLDWLLSDEGSFFFWNGKEGTDFVFEAGENIVGGDKYIKPLYEGRADAIYWAPAEMPIYDRVSYRTYAPKTDIEDINYNLILDSDAYKPYYKHTNVPPIVWKSADLQAEIADARTILNSIIETGSTEFVLGRRDINDDAAWESYKQELESAGLAQYLDLLREYYDAK